ncbi:hypothetical protein JCM8547_000722 [Rhodosporidiobolus lusitaniae]
MDGEAPQPYPELGTAFDTLSEFLQAVRASPFIASQLSPSCYLPLVVDESFLIERELKSSAAVTCKLGKCQSGKKGRSGRRRTEDELCNFSITAAFDPTSSSFVVQSFTPHLQQAHDLDFHPSPLVENNRSLSDDENDTITALSPSSAPSLSPKSSKKSPRRLRHTLHDPVTGKFTSSRQNSVVETIDEEAASGSSDGQPGKFVIPLLPPSKSRCTHRQKRRRTHAQRSHIDDEVWLAWRVLLGEPVDNGDDEGRRRVELEEVSRMGGRGALRGWGWWEGPESSEEEEGPVETESVEVGRVDEGVMQVEKDSAAALASELPPSSDDIPYEDDAMDLDFDPKIPPSRSRKRPTGKKPAAAKQQQPLFRSPSSLSEVEEQQKVATKAPANEKKKDDLGATAFPSRSASPYSTAVAFFSRPNWVEMKAIPSYRPSPSPHFVTPFSRPERPAPRLATTAPPTLTPVSTAISTAVTCHRLSTQPAQAPKPPLVYTKRRCPPPPPPLHPVVLPTATSSGVEVASPIEEGEIEESRRVPGRALGRAQDGAENEQEEEALQALLELASGKRDSAKQDLPPCSSTAEVAPMYTVKDEWDYPVQDQWGSLSSSPSTTASFEFSPRQSRDRSSSFSSLPSPTLHSPSKTRQFNYPPFPSSAYSPPASVAASASALAFPPRASGASASSNGKARTSGGGGPTFSSFSGSKAQAVAMASAQASQGASWGGKVDDRWAPREEGLTEDYVQRFEQRLWAKGGEQESSGPLDSLYSPANLSVKTSRLLTFDSSFSLPSSLSSTSPCSASLLRLLSSRPKKPPRHRLPTPQSFPTSRTPAALLSQFSDARTRFALEYLYGRSVSEGECQFLEKREKAVWGLARVMAGVAEVNERVKRLDRRDEGRRGGAWYNRQ